MGSEVDNSPDRLIQVYFYGLYLDPEVLRGKGVEPRSARPGLVTGRVLRIGRQATLLRSVGGQACGVVYSMTHDELDRLYAGLPDYRDRGLGARSGASHKGCRITSRGRVVVAGGPCGVTAQTELVTDLAATNV